MELLSNTKRRAATCVATVAVAGLGLGALAYGDGNTSAVAASGTTGTTGDTAALGAPGGGPPPGGGPLGELTDDQIQCLKDEGVSVPGKPAAGEKPQPPDESDRPDPEAMKSAAEACDIDLPEPPSGGGMGAPGPPPQGNGGAPCATPPKADSDSKKSQNNNGSKKN